MREKTISKIDHKPTRLKYLLFQQRKVFLSSIPQNLEINSKILVDHFVSHSCNFFPRNAKISLSYFFGNLFGSFTHNFYSAGNSKNGFATALIDFVYLGDWDWLKKYTEGMFQS